MNAMGSVSERREILIDTISIQLEIVKQLVVKLGLLTESLRVLMSIGSEDGL